jgi:hypothetical protein
VNVERDPADGAWERADRADRRREVLLWSSAVVAVGVIVAVTFLVVANRTSNDDVAIDTAFDDSDERLPPLGQTDGTATSGRRARPGLDADTPPVIDLRGDNFETVWRQAQVLEGWLLRHPDPNLVAQIYVPGTPTYDEVHGYIDELARNGRAVVVERYRIVDVSLVERRTPDEVELRYTDTYASRQLIDARSGAVLSRDASDGGERAWSLVLRRGTDGRWRVASITPAPA